METLLHLVCRTHNEVVYTKMKIKAMKCYRSTAAVSSTTKTTLYRHFVKRQ